MTYFYWLQTDLAPPGEKVYFGATIFVNQEIDFQKGKSLVTELILEIESRSFE